MPSNQIDLTALTPDMIKMQKELLELLEAKENELRYNKITALFPDTGPYRRELYPKHVAWMNASAEYRQLAMVAANRTGKTMAGAYATTCHLTGIYPYWWKGVKFLNPVDIWAAGITNQSTKEIQQYELLGDYNDPGSGMIPKHLIHGTPTKKPGVAGAIETVYVQHVSGGLSRLTFKSYDQGRDAFQGTKKQLIWLDEEPRDIGIYSECLTRLTDEHRPGIMLCTFTPLFGLSEVVLSFLPDGKFPIAGEKREENQYKYVVNIDWDEVPHLTDAQKKELLASYSPHEREARSKGVPSLGAGAVYPYPEHTVTYDPTEIKIQPYWPKAYGLDVGWNKTAAVWGAFDPDSRILYIYSEHYAGESHPAIHAHAIKARGEWMIGAIDPASSGVNQADGRALFDLYEQEGLNLIPADNCRSGPESGILRVGQMLESGLCKVSTACTNLLSEYRVYRRDEHGKIVKKRDHALDAWRYLCMTGVDYLELPPEKDKHNDRDYEVVRDEDTGY